MEQMQQKRYSDTFAHGEHEQTIHYFVEQINSGELSSIDVVYSHPDDMIYMAGFINQLMSRVSKYADFTINAHVMTNGEMGFEEDKLADSEEYMHEDPGFGNKRLIEDFNAWQELLGEEIAASNKFGLHVYGLPDGMLSDYKGKLDQAVAEIVAGKGKNLVLAIDNSEKHNDHGALLESILFNTQDTPLLTFGTSELDHSAQVEHDPNFIGKVASIVGKYATQFPNGELPDSVELLAYWSFYSLKQSGVDRSSQAWSAKHSTLAA
jgi:LmbE family N-acetylglucosaminyl deacetylase